MRYPRTLSIHPFFINTLHTPPTSSLFHPSPPLSPPFPNPPTRSYPLSTYTLLLNLTHPTSQVPSTRLTQIQSHRPRNLILYLPLPYLPRYRDIQSISLPHNLSYPKARLKYPTSSPQQQHQHHVMMSALKLAKNHNLGTGLRILSWSNAFQSSSLIGRNFGVIFAR